MIQSKSSIVMLSLMTILFQACGGTTKTSTNLENISYEKASNTQKKLFYITSKTEIKSDKNVTTNYTYKNGYLTEVDIHLTEGLIDKKVYKYFENHKVMKTYDVDGNVQSVSTFESLNNPNSSYLYDGRLSFDKNVKYLIFVNDTVTYQTKTQIKKFININATGNIYRYDNSNFLSKIENGVFDNNSSDALAELDNDENTSFLLSSTNIPLAFSSQQGTFYHYDINHVLKGIAFEGESKKITIDANVTFYDSGLLKKLTLSTGDDFSYSSDGYLTKKVTFKNGIKSILNYTYSKDLKTISVKDASRRLIETYKFEEIIKDRLNG